MRSLLFILTFWSINIYAGPLTLNEIRILYKKSAVEESYCIKLLRSLKMFNETTDPLRAAYKASATMIKAKYSINPVSKLSYFNDGKKLMEKCIQADKNNIEIRFLRFAIQCSAPAFLDYNKSIAIDKNFLLKHVTQIMDLELKQNILSFLRSSNQLSQSEKDSLKP